MGVFMSQQFVKVPVNLIKDKNINDSTFRIYCLIKSFADFSTGDNCFPSSKTIADLAGKCRKTVTSAIRSLKLMGYINVQSGGIGVSNRYSFTDAVREQLVTHGEYPVTHDVSNQIPTPCATGYSLPRTNYQEPITNVQTFSPNPVSVRDIMLSSWRMAVTGLGTTAMAVASA